MRLAVLVMLWPAVAYAQAPSPSPSPSGPRLTLTGQVRIRAEHRTPLARVGEGDLAVLQRSRLGLRAELPRAAGYVEVQDARTWGTETSPASNEKNLDLHQAWIRLPDLAHGRLALTAGRQELAYGDERLLGASDWTNNARSFDAGLVRWAWRTGSVDAFGALVNDRRTAGRGDGDQAFSGLYARLLRGRKDVELDAYALALTDGLATPGEGVGTDDVAIGTLGARFRRAPAAGPQVSLEGALQRGHRGPDDHEAWALAAWVGYAFDARWRPVLRAEVDLATGDGAPRDGTSSEFHNLFPTNHAVYGYADLAGWRNLRAFRLGLATTPRRGHTASVDLWSLGLDESRGAWKDAGGELLGQDPAGAAGRDLGRELDLLWRFPLRDDVATLVGYSLFFPGDFTRAVRTDRTQRFAYLQLLLKF